MSNSFQIQPQRQVRDKTRKGTKSDTEIGKPQDTSLMWSRGGGQLLDFRKIDKTLLRKENETMAEIERFVGKEGAFNALVDQGINEHIAKKRQEAKDYYKKDAQARAITGAIANEALRTAKAGAQEEARKIALRNPYVNHFYQELRASEAASSVGPALEKWGEQNASGLASLDVQKRAKAIQDKTAKLLAPWSDLPSDYKTAIVDPYLIAANNTIGGHVLTAEDDDKLALNRQTVASTIETQLKASATAKKAAAEKGWTSGQLYTWGSEGLGLAYSKGLAKYKELNPLGTEKDYNSIWFDIAQNLFMNTDEDGYNDMGEGNTYLDYINGFREAKTESGIELLKLKKTKTVNGVERVVTFEQELMAGMLNAQTKADKLRKLLEDGDKKVKAEFESTVTTAMKAFFKEKQDRTVPEVQAEKARLRTEALKKGSLTIAQINAVLDAKFPEVWKSKDKSIVEGLKNEVELAISTYSLTDIDQLKDDRFGDLYQRITGTEAYGHAIDKMGAQTKKTVKDVNRNTEILLKSLADGLENNFKEKDSDYKNLLISKPLKSKGNKAVNKAVEVAGTYLKDAARNYVKDAINSLPPDKVNDKNELSRILSEARVLFYNRDDFSDVDKWVSLNPTNIGKETHRIYGPPLGNTDTYTPGENGGWKSGVEDDTNRYTWANKARTVFSVLDSKAAKTYLSENFVFSDNELGEIISAAITGDLSKLSEKTKEVLADVERAFNGTVSPEDIVWIQASRYITADGGKMPPRPLIQPNLDLLNKTNSKPVASTGLTARSESIFMFPNDFSDSIEFKIERVNGVQTRNTIDSPFTGTVVEVEDYDDSGLTIVLESSEAGPYYDKGTKIVVSHCAAIDLEVGTKVNRGEPLCLSGDTSELNSTDGKSTTGEGIEPGHMKMQFIRPGYDLKSVGNTDTFLYGQSYGIKDPFDEKTWPDAPGLLSPFVQKRLFRSLVVPLYTEFN